MKFFLAILLTMFAFTVSAKRKVNYEYKKYERFDFEALDVAGDNSSPGDLSISPRLKRDMKNKIPQRKNFHREMKKAIDSLL